jgi:hypothetical protein
MVWLKRIVLFLIFACASLVGLFPLFYRSVQPMAYPGQVPEAPSHLNAGLTSVLLIFLVDVFILWVLSKIGGPLKAEVKASIKKFGGSIWITGAGIVGCFLAIAIIGIGGVYLLSK